MSARYTERMQVGFRWVALACIALAACGGGDDGAAADDAGQHTDKDAGSKPGQKTMLCGTKTCSLPADSPFEPCCRDMFTSTCGTLFSGTCQAERVEGSDECPLPKSDLFAVARDKGMGGVSACCAKNGECGLDLGVGVGCTATRELCLQFPPEYREDFRIMTCDGEELPDQGACAVE
ncbi:MAG TPA: hypothetical protein VJR89_08800 [Polyangiales bacterium]|nr:hypothetical protein [Polyangiales bacterium]